MGRIAKRLSKFLSFLAEAKIGYAGLAIGCETFQLNDQNKSLCHPLEEA